MNQIQTKPNVTQVKEVKTYTGDAARILKLIGRGNCNQAQAAKACGVDESYVSQLMAEENFQIQVAQMIQQAVETATVIDENYDKVEKLLSERLLAAANMMFGPDNILRTLKFVNEAKKRLSPIGGGTLAPGANGAGAVAMVQLVLPTKFRHEYTVNPNGEVLEVNGMELVTMDSSKMESFSKAQRNIPKALPRGETTLIKGLPNVSSRKQSTDPWADL